LGYEIYRVFGRKFRHHLQYSSEGGWVRQNTPVVGSYLLVWRWRHVSAVLGHLQVIWPEDGQARPKHVVIIKAINTILGQLCFDGPTHSYLHKTQRGWWTWRFSIPHKNGHEYLKNVQYFLFLIWVTTVIAMVRTKFYFSPYLDWLWGPRIILSSEYGVDCFLGSKWAEMISWPIGPLRMLRLGCDAG
jgi:hypothetical protein